MPRAATGKVQAYLWLSWRVFADIQPAADKTLGDALAVVERLYPMADRHDLALQLK